VLLPDEEVLSMAEALTLDTAGLQLLTLYIRNSLLVTDTVCTSSHQTPSSILPYLLGRYFSRYGARSITITNMLVLYGCCLLYVYICSSASSYLPSSNTPPIRIQQGSSCLKVDDPVFPKSQRATSRVLSGGRQRNRGYLCIWVCKF